MGKFKGLSGLGNVAKIAGAANSFGSGGGGNKSPTIKINMSSSIKGGLPKLDIPNLSTITSQVNNIPEIKESGINIDPSMLKGAIDTPKLPTVSDVKSAVTKVKELKPSDIKDAVKGKYSEAKSTISAVKENGPSALIPEEYKQLGQMAKDSGIFKKEG